MVRAEGKIARKFANKEALKEELRLRLTGHTLTKLTTGTEVINVIDRKIQKETLTKRLKQGWILKKDFDKDYKIIVEWDLLRRIIRDTRDEIKELKEAIPTMKDQIASIESGKWSTLKPMLPRYREILENDEKALAVKNRKLEKARREYKPLNSVITELKNTFKSYIQGLDETI